eukprot:c25292_g1_i1.p1 GENE.c25292_g1_i1~~c25292_g1_i1.p1  ORF type:complete len:268 (+),score=46.02 c25292_g1_i1:67-870(+)
MVFRLAVALLAMALAVAAQSTASSSCITSWTDSKGTTFPLQYVANTLYLMKNTSIGTTNYDVTFEFCTPVYCPSNHTHPAGFLPSVCHVPLTSSDARFMGSLNVTSFADGNATMYSTPNFAITFGGGDQCHNNGRPNRQTTINLVCCSTCTSDQLTMLGEVSYCHYYIQLQSARVCPGYTPPQPAPGRRKKRGISGGSVILILFFVGLFLYFTVGMAYKALVVGSRGIEMVPNIGFWRSLPGLVLDGVNFVVSCGKNRPGTASYDNI